MSPTVLIADDDKGTRDLFRSFFVKQGWEYVLVPDGISLLDAASKKEFDVILTDLQMPQMNGLEVVRRIRLQSPQQPIIVVTGSANVQDVVTSLREGASDILFKPFDMEVLRNSVERIVQSRRRASGDERTAYSFLESESTVLNIPVSELAKMNYSVGLVEKLARAGTIDRTLKLRLQLAIQEAIANSLEHGSLELQSSWKDEFDDEGRDKFSLIKTQRLADPHYGARKIRIATNYKNCRLEISIRDEGKGFGLRENAPLDTDGRPVRCYGRGLAIITGTMDEVSFGHQGAEIVMVKYLI